MLNETAEVSTDVSHPMYGSSACGGGMITNMPISCLYKVSNGADGPL